MRKENYFLLPTYEVLYSLFENKNVLDKLEGIEEDSN